MNSTITHVKHLQEELQRFNPDARIESPLDVQGVSPSTLCVITSTREDQLQKKINELYDDLKGLEKRLENIREECSEETPNIEKIKEFTGL